ncbi:MULTISPECIES: arsenate reductase ArsC [unclassified Achromobacter]|uniref:arsenate reductase ArsC n=1 Tax=unclassified Achromobacter TaxID=2626865 RepID=UPI000B51B531|nr:MULTISPECIES: arsenate reductase ArsC [unclassified Achromobacter]OWT80288.1 protein-tyrosine-phosphatase [Achromobacter sp. HZ34]OWT82171.1 protein-tyrosine-phosphatase [Achromobacter sp. HZ28]
MSTTAASVSCNVLFLCTGNSARSILAEGLLNGLANGRFHAYSAGSQPKGEVHPIALTTLGELSLPTDGYRSKRWDEFAGAGAPHMDVIITVCDNAASEVCPIWPGHPMTAHWGVPDPAAQEGTPEEKRQAFHDAARALKRRIEMFLSLPIERLDAISLQTALRQIGQTQQ